MDGLFKKPPIFLKACMVMDVDVYLTNGTAHGCARFYLAQPLRMTPPSSKKFPESL
jgi:hypothetical protein